MNTTATATMGSVALYARKRQPQPPASEDRLLGFLLGGCIAAFLIGGLALHSMELPPHAMPREETAQRVTFLAPPEPIVTPEPQPVVAPEPEAAPELTPETILNQAIDLTAPEPEVETTPSIEAVEQPEPPRRVYGVRKVFARGLGAGAGGEGAIVVKRGNTLDGKADTLTATERDLQGTLAPLSTVTRAPKPIERHKPGYSEALREAQARGTVTARLLIDIEGRVRRVEVVQDIGFDSRELAIVAFEKFRFEPAMRDDAPVAVWITHKIRFEFQE